MARAALAIIAGIALLACGSASRASEAAARPERSIVPWTSAPPSIVPYAAPTPPPIPTGVRVCDAGELRLEARPRQDAGGSIVGGFHLVNVAPVPCLIAGTFALRFVTASGMVALSARPGALPLDRRSETAPGWAIAGPPLPVPVLRRVAGRTGHRDVDATTWLSVG